MKCWIKYKYKYGAKILFHLNIVYNIVNRIIGVVKKKTFYMKSHLGWYYWVNTKHGVARLDRVEGALYFKVIRKKRLSVQDDPKLLGDGGGAPNQMEWLSIWFRLWIGSLPDGKPCCMLQKKNNQCVCQKGGWKQFEKSPRPFHFTCTGSLMEWVM